jgi:hypothetical protein
MLRFISLIYTKKRRGSSIDLWGTPPEEEHREDEVSFNTTF